MSWLRSSPGVIELVKAMVERCGCETTLYCHCSCDDQVVLNSMMLLESPYKVIWDRNGNGNENENNASTTVLIPTKEEDMSWESKTGTVSNTGHRVKFGIDILRSDTTTILII